MKVMSELEVSYLNHAHLWVFMYCACPGKISMNKPEFLPEEAEQT
jgi:hypothetical protein